jgi:hypothetical protein
MKEMYYIWERQETIRKLELENSEEKAEKPTPIKTVKHGMAYSLLLLMKFKGRDLGAYGRTLNSSISIREIREN